MKLNFTNCMKKIKVLMIMSAYPTEKTPAESVFFKEQAKAVSLYNKVTILYPYPTKRVGMKVKKEKKDIDTIRIEINKSLPKVVGLNYLVSFLYVGFKLSSQFDLIHCQKSFPAGVVGRVLAKIKKCPLIITEHSGNVKHMVRSFWRYKLIKWTMEGSEKVIVVSEKLKKEIVKIGIKVEPEVIPNPVDITKFTPKENKRKKIKTLLHISSLNKYKGIPYLLQSLYELKKKRDDFTLKLVGNEKNMKKIKKLISSLQLEKVIQTFPPLPHSSLPLFFFTSNFFVLPSISESFSVVLIESLASGRPVIATRSGGPEEIVTKEVGILVKPKEVKELGEAIEYMLDNFYKYDPKKLSKYVEKNFSLQVVGKRLTEVYKRCIKR